MANHTNILKQRAAQAKRDYVAPVEAPEAVVDETTPEPVTPPEIATETQTAASDAVAVVSTPPAGTKTVNRSK